MSLLRTAAPLLSDMLVDAYKTNKEAAIDLAKRASTGVASQALDLATAATATLMTAIANDGASAHQLAMSAT
jgi:hypothetical protein